MNILKNQPRKMANNQDSWSKIKSRYGDGVVRYLKVQDVQPEKIVGSVYKVLHVDILNQCAKISTTLREKCLNGPPMKKRRMNNSSDSQSGYNCYDLPGILKTIFTVKKDLYSEKKIFLSSLRWRRRMNHYIKTQERKKTWVQVNPVDDSIQKDTVVSAANCNLYPKENGVRCVHSYRIDQSIRDDKATPTFAMLKVLLQQLYNEKYESTTIQKLYPLWLSLAEEKQQNPNHPYFLVSTDIVDAYGSVIQTKLYNILHEMIMEIPGDKITLEWLAILKPNLFYKKNSVEYIQWFSCCSSLPPIPPHSLISFATSDQHPKEFISKEKICSLLQKCITQQIVSYKDTKYILKEGLPQGFPLSPILSDIYYAHMTKQEFAVFMKSGVLARYVDDFLYITDQKDAAKEFMNRVRKGVPEYHCRFKTSKTQTNLISARWGSTEYVTYLGYLIDCATLEVSPLHTDSKFHHLKSMQCIKYKNEQQTLAMRLRNFSALKLSPIVLDPKINSIGTILSTVRSAAYTMASRCAVLIPRVYPKCQSYVCEIWEEVRRAVEIVTSKFVTYFRKKRNKPSRTVTRYIKTLIWKKFYEVFAKNASLHQCFGKDIRRMVQNQSVI
ncbi:telomerase reverse transcriptase-like isoform X2 [Venturia canescens]|uniref:telomerase reverse transcriptase-like isoform X2 n=1 Tax=Venturia canescens TaxID=32260 RepID=UPI001C9C7252|nr:telomerase reverse transcriptase-like isoform X2 [Venturia canescens]